MPERKTDLFVSYAGSDQAWAEWAAWQLEKAGYTVELRVWDWAAGQNIVTALNDAIGRTRRFLAILSRAYFDRAQQTTLEWTTAAGMPGMTEGRLVPVWVEKVADSLVPPLFQSLDCRNLYNLAAEAARQVLLEAVAPRHPDQEPSFPGGAMPRHRDQPDGSAPRLPGARPTVWKIPAQIRGFTGRDGLLAALRDELRSGRAPVQALHGMGGVGKTQLAKEYVYRFASEYDVAWWIDAEQSELIGEQFAELAARLGCAEASAPGGTNGGAVLTELAGRHRWLVVFDNVANPQDVFDWLPGGDGHVLITSRTPDWDEIAAPVEVHELASAESAAILGKRVPDLSYADADMLANALGNLPLAIAQAAGYLKLTGMRADTYKELLETRTAEILSQGIPRPHYPMSLAAATYLVADQLAEKDPASTELLSICAYLAPEPIPQEWFTRNPELLPPMLATRAEDRLEWGSMIIDLQAEGIANVDHRGLQFHQLTQAILRDCLSLDHRAAARTCAEEIMTADDAGSPDDPATWTSWARLMPHLLACGPAATANPRLRSLACKGAWYLLKRGEADSCYDLASQLHENWSARLGAENQHTLSIVNTMAAALREKGDYVGARGLDQESLARERRRHGKNHRDTLLSARHLAADMRGQADRQSARELETDTLARYRRVLGPDHPETLACADGLADDLRALGDYAGARDLDEDILARRRRVPGPDHPDTLATAENLIADLRALGDG
jgi:TIR domain/Tetratricopeptide repeat/NB-ARC domain